MAVAELHRSLRRRAPSRKAASLRRRAPADLRVNTLKATREKVLKALAEFGASKTPACRRFGVRVPPPVGTARTPNLEAEAAFQAGWFEIQDEGSQIAALLAGAGPRLQVLDLCAGAGGKTLALAGAMQNTGQIYAYDDDRNRLKPIFERVKRAGVRNVQVLRGGDQTALDALGPKFDLVLVDAPCTGTGTWRRRPDSKWKLKARNLASARPSRPPCSPPRAASPTWRPPRLRHLLAAAGRKPRHDGKVLGRRAGIPSRSLRAVWLERLGTEPRASLDGRTDTLQFTPVSHGTDGFLIAILERRRQTRSYRIFRAPVLQSRKAAIAIVVGPCSTCGFRSGWWPPG